MSIDLGDASLYAHLHQEPARCVGDIYGDQLDRAAQAFTDSIDQGALSSAPAPTATAPTSLWSFNGSGSTISFDTEQIQARLMSRDQIARAYNVPPGMIGGLKVAVDPSIPPGGFGISTPDPLSDTSRWSVLGTMADDRLQFVRDDDLYADSYSNPYSYASVVRDSGLIQQDSAWAKFVYAWTDVDWNPEPFAWLDTAAFNAATVDLMGAWDELVESNDTHALMARTLMSDGLGSTMLPIQAKPQQYPWTPLPAFDDLDWLAGWVVPDVWKAQP